MKHLLIFPPQWTPINPYLAIPSLMGQLEKEGFNAEALDINIDFYNDILKKSYLENSIKRLKKIDVTSFFETKKNDINNEQINDYPIEIKERFLKNKTIKEYLEKKSLLLKIIPNEIEKAVSNIKNPKHFYNPEILLNSFKTIHYALEIASLPYAPSRVQFFNFINPLLKYDYESLKYNVFSESTNIFIDYYKKWLPIIQKKKPKFIGISISTESQLIAGLTLANLLKNNTTAHINIGGNYFSRIVDAILKHPDFFDIFADSISIDEGEKPIIELAKYINNKIQISEVPNLIYKKDKEIIVNKKCIPLKMNDIQLPSFKGFNFSKYLTPQIVLPIQTTRGCYWNKCAFCDIPYGKQHSIKDLDNLIEELKEYNKKYGLNHFYIVDESIHPKYLEEMAEKIIENKLAINYYCPLRTEKIITKETLAKARKSGMRMALWGIESGSKRVMELINKGIDLENRMELLQESSNADIWNHVFAFFGFPSETINEARETIELLSKNSKTINSCAIGTFKLGKHSEVRRNPENYEITKINTKEEFSPFIDFEEERTALQKAEYIKQLHIEAGQKIYEPSLWKYCNCDQYLFLYITHYGLAWVKNYKI